MIVSPSILSADFTKLKESIETVRKAPFLHIDVMDGVFVPNISFGQMIQSQIRPYFKDQVFDTHLMIVDPIKYIDDFAKAGSDYITFHVEANSDVIKCIEKIHLHGIKAGISIKPLTSVDCIEKYLEYVDLVLVMSVEPGFGGQKFMPESLDKIRRLKELKEKNGYKYLISVDGGINQETANYVKEAGTDIVVAGSYIFKQTDKDKIIEELSL